MATLKRFIHYYKPYRGTFFFDMFCAAVMSGIDLTVPMFINYLLKNVFGLADKLQLTSTVLRLSMVLLVLYLIRMAAQYYITSWGHIMGAKMEADMRRDLFNHFEKLSFSYYDKNNTGHMMSRIVSDLFDISELAHHGPEDIFISLIKLTGSFLILLSINVPITLILLAITVFMLLFSVVYNRRMRKVFMDNRHKIAEVNAVVQDSLSGIRVVKAFAGEELEQEKFEQGNHRFLLSKKDSYLIMGKYFSINGFMQGVMYLSVILSGCIFISKGLITGTDIIIYFLYINMFLDPVNRLVNFTEQFQKGYTGFLRMVQILDTEPDVQDEKDATAVGPLRGEIRFDEVSFGYGDEPVLQKLDLVIPKGRTIALVGPSGAGKTTICSLIPRFYDVTGGAISIDGVDIRKMTQASLRRNIGVVQQDVYLFNSTVRENIAYGNPEADDDAIIDAAKKANIHEFILSLENGYETLVGERGVRFSGGQKQRISIARAFLKNPPVLILDEATSALDNESERYIQSSLAELAKNRTTVIIAHRLSTIRNADEIVVLTDAGVAERGTHHDLIENGGLYAQLYNMQFDE